ncbi:MAG: hypothetical protein J6V24_01715 [Clostridia bacterium]|nr:hypothetical protein [Clostridia bacterium]
MQNIRRVRDIVSIKRTIWSNYDRFRTLPVFYLERNEVLDAVAALPEEEIAEIAADCREGGVRWRSFTKYMNKIESALLAGREVLDWSQKDEPLFETVAGVPVSDFVKIEERASGAAVSFAVRGTFDLLQRGNRNGCTEIRGLPVTPETSFTVVNELLPYWEDRYSVALKSPGLSFAISAEDPKLGKKGTSCIRLYVIEEGAVKIDDLGKYTDTTPLTLWITP